MFYNHRLWGCVNPRYNTCILLVTRNSGSDKDFRCLQGVSGDSVRGCSSHNIFGERFVANHYINVRTELCNNSVNMSFTKSPKIVCKLHMKLQITAAVNGNGTNFWKATELVCILLFNTIMHSLLYDNSIPQLTYPYPPENLGCLCRWPKANNAGRNWICIAL